MAVYRSKRLLFALLIFIGIVFIKSAPFLIAGLIFILAIIFNKKAVNPLKNYKFWIIIIVLVIIVPIFSDFQDRSFLGIDYNSEQLAKTILMTLRGISVFLLFQVITTDLNIDTIKPVFSRFGFKNFDVLYKLSNDISPKIKSILNARYNLFKLDWKRGKSVNSFILFLTDIFSDFFKLIDSLIQTETESYSITPNVFIDKYVFINSPSIFIIVGDAGIGKTPWIENLVKLLKRDGKSIDGVLSKKEIISKDNWYHNLINISNDEKHQLTTMDEIHTNTMVGKFYFYEETIEWGNKHLISITNSDFIIIDEIGLLEFDNKGFSSGLKYISENYTGNLIITIRSSLQNRFDEFLISKFENISDWNKEYIEL